jgi:hypothetical protein
MYDYQQPPSVLSRLDRIAGNVGEGLGKVAEALIKFSDSSERLVDNREYVAALSAEVAKIATRTECLSGQVDSLNGKVSALRAEIAKYPDADTATPPSPDGSDDDQAEGVRAAMILNHQLDRLTWAILNNYDGIYVDEYLAQEKISLDRVMELGPGKDAGQWERLTSAWINLFGNLKEDDHRVDRLIQIQSVRELIKECCLPTNIRHPAA